MSQKVRGWCRKTFLVDEALSPEIDEGSCGKRIWEIWD